MRFAHMLAVEHEVRDFDRWWSQVQGGRVHLATLGTALLAYRSLTDPNHVFVCMALSARESMEGLLRSGVVLEWFDAAGVEEVPPIFVGRDGARFDVDVTRSAVPQVVVTTVARVADPSRVMDRLTRDENAMRAWGVRRTYVYRALDDEREVLIIQALDSEEHAARWLQHHELLGEWLTGEGEGVYPPVFAGTLGGSLAPEPVR